MTRPSSSIDPDGLAKLSADLLVESLRTLAKGRPTREGPGLVRWQKDRAFWLTAEPIGTLLGQAGLEWPGAVHALERRWPGLLDGRAYPRLSYLLSNVRKGQYDRLLVEEVRG